MQHGLFFRFFFLLLRFNTRKMPRFVRLARDRGIDIDCHKVSCHSFDFGRVEFVHCGRDALLEKRIHISANWNVVILYNSYLCFKSQNGRFTVQNITSLVLRARKSTSVNLINFNDLNDDVEVCFLNECSWLRQKRV